MAEKVINVSMKAKTLREILACVATMTDFAKISVVEGRVVFVGVDPAHIALLSVELGGSDFTGEFTPGVYEMQMDDMLSFLTHADDEDVSFSVSYEDRRVKMNTELMSLEFGADDTEGTTVLDLDKMAAGWGLKVSAAVSVGVLKRAAKHCATISDHMRLEIRGDKLFVSTNNEDVSLKYAIPGTVERAEKGLTAKSLYPIEYFENVVNVVAAQRNYAQSIRNDGNAPVRLRLGNDLPLLLEWEIGMGTKVKFGLAPRIESESD